MELSRQQAERTAWVTLPLVVALGVLFALTGSHRGATVGDVPLFAVAVAAAFVVQWIVFVLAWTWQTERFFDLTGSLTYVSVTLLVLTLTPDPDPRSYLLAALVVVWAVRLGSFLFLRVSRTGDDRFDEIKPSLPRFLAVWTLQGLWVTITAAAAWVAITSTHREPLGWLAAVGALLWVVGFGIEVVADEQKRRFKADPTNRGRFISTGLWSRSRHPNYFGEILLWIGVAVVAAPGFVGWQWIALLSPVFVTVLLTRVSGVPLLERRADQKWGGQPDYEAYKKSTPVLTPRP